MDTLAVFRSRSEALRFFSLLKSKRIACTTVNTPQRIGVGCGVSVVFSSSVLSEVKRLISSSSPSSFVGFYRK